MVALAPAQWRPYPAVIPKQLRLTMFSGDGWYFHMSRFGHQGANVPHELFRMGFWPDREARDDAIDIPFNGFPNPLTFDWLVYLPLENYSEDAHDPWALIDKDHPFKWDYANHTHTGYDPLREKNYQRGWYYEYYVVQYPILGNIRKNPLPWTGFTYRASGTTGEDCFTVRMTNGRQESNTFRVNITINQKLQHVGV